MPIAVVRQTLRTSLLCFLSTTVLFTGIALPITLRSGVSLQALWLAARSGIAFGVIFTCGIAVAYRSTRVRVEVRHDQVEQFLDRALLQVGFKLRSRHVDGSSLFEPRRRSVAISRLVSTNVLDNCVEIIGPAYDVGRIVREMRRLAGYSTNQ